MFVKSRRNDIVSDEGNAKEKPRMSGALSIEQI